MSYLFETSLKSKFKITSSFHSKLSWQLFMRLFCFLKSLFDSLVENSYLFKTTVNN